jgi:hypothetical protein
MATPLRTTIQSLAAKFAAGVVDAIRDASLEEVLGQPSSAPETRGPGRPAKVGAPVPKRASAGRQPRRSADDVARVIDLITSALKDAKDGLRSEQLQEVLKLSKKEIVRPLSVALASKKISKKGQKRATTYFAK